MIPLGIEPATLNYYCIKYYYCKPRYISFTVVVCSHVLQLRFAWKVIV